METRISRSPLSKSLLLFLLFCSSGLQTRRNLIEDLKIKENRLIIRPNSYLVEHYLNEDRFIVTYENDINLEALDYETVTAPYVLSMASLIWVSGKKFYLPKMDERLYNSLLVIKEVYKVFYPEATWNGELIPLELTNRKMETPDPNTIGMCFSGGLDSTYSSLVHNDKKQLLMTIHGFSEESDYERWQTIKAQMTDFAREYGNKKNYFVRSNFRRITLGPKLATLYPTLTPWREYCQESLGLAGIAIPILATSNCDRFLIPSTFTWNFPYAWGSHPYIDSNIKFGSIRMQGHDYDASRRAKINFLKKLPERGLKKPTLFTCRHEENCRACISCMKGLQTVNTMLLENENPQDYGFKTDKQETMRATKEILSQDFPFPAFDKSEELGWEKIQKYAADLLQQEQLDEPFKQYLIWLQTIDFHTFINNFDYFEDTLDFTKYMKFLNNDWRQNFLRCIKRDKKKLSISTYK